MLVLTSKLVVELKLSTLQIHKEDVRYERDLCNYAAKKNTFNNSTCFLIFLKAFEEFRKKEVKIKCKLNEVFT